MKANLEEQRKKNQNWYDQRYNEDATQRTVMRSVFLTKTEESFRNRNRAAQGLLPMGGTEESVAATKAANFTGFGRCHKSDCCANAEARK